MTDAGGRSGAREASFTLHSERTWQLLAGVAGVGCPTKLAGEACKPAELPLPCPNPGSGTEQARLSGKLRLRSCTALAVCNWLQAIIVIKSTQVRVHVPQS